MKPRYTTSGGDDAYVINVELPGVPKDAISIDLEKDVLTIQGTRKAPVPEAWKPLHRELNHLGYTLRLRLNAPVDDSKLTANFADGVLTVKLPIKEAAKPRRIEVN
jgi:HSP20 family protein